MKSRDRRAMRIARIVACLCLGASVVPGMARATTVNRIIATVDGEPITSHQLDDFIRLNTRGVDPDKLSETDRSRALEMLITDMLIQAETNVAGIKASKEDVDHYIDQIKEKNKLDDAGLADALKAQGLTVEQYRDQVRKEIEKSQLLSREIRSRVNITPEEIERYYKAHLDDYAAPETIHVRQIFFKLDSDASDADVAAVMAKAKDVRARIEKGEDFEKLAAQFSEGPDADKGGDLGTVGKGQMLPELEKAAFELKPKQVSEPIRTKMGVHILRVDSRSSATHVKLDDVKDDIKEKLYSQAIEARYQRWIDEDLKSSHSVVIR
ncbi:MAG TPA: peptidylprolyl isomerase [Candidatus Bathyarchaeia archaeon]|nr:peptidylprolyl isomerase [Candidatus Bathyarchaeia archaeon]